MKLWGSSQKTLLCVMVLCGVTLLSDPVAAKSDTYPPPPPESFDDKSEHNQEFKPACKIKYPPADEMLRDELNNLSLQEAFSDADLVFIGKVISKSGHAAYSKCGPRDDESIIGFEPLICIKGECKSKAINITKYCFRHPQLHSQQLCINNTDIGKEFLIFAQMLDQGKEKFFLIKKEFPSYELKNIEENIKI